MTTKIHLSTDEHSKDHAPDLTAGQTAGVNVALDVVQRLKTSKVIADKAYDADDCCIIRQ